MEPLRLAVRTTPAQSTFKKLMGQNNHFLITILVGLDGVEAGEVTLSPTFSTSWAPHDVKTSARRSREFAIKALLAWAADSLDTYRKLLTKPNDLFLSTSECTAINAQEGLWLRLKHLAQLRDVPMAEEAAMVELLVLWRNVVVHTKSRDAVTGDLRNRLLARQDAIAEKYRGLDIQRAMKAASNGSVPSFKEVTSIVSAAHSFVEQVDRAVAARVDLEHCLRAVLAAHVAEEPIKRTANIWGRTPDRRRASILQVARNAGMSTDPNGELISTEFTDALLKWTPTDARRELLQGAEE